MKLAALALIAVGGFFLIYNNQSAPSSSPTLESLSSYLTPTIDFLMIGAGAFLLYREFR